MSDTTKENLGFILVIMAGFFLGSGIAHMATDWSWRRQIAGHHCAEFYIDGRNYRQWRWIDCNKQ